jgi:hypothetical protein
MTRDDIIRMAVEVGARYCASPDKWGVFEISYEGLFNFAALVAAHEREECAKVAENGLIGHTIAKAIRARGKK